MNAKIFKKLILGLMVLSLVLPAQLAFAAERVLTVGGNTASRPITDFGINVVDEYYVDSVNGDDGRRGLSPKTAVATLDYAVSLCTANQGDIIHLMPNSDETVATAAAINIDVAGVRIVGHGDGADRPTFTFSTVDSTITFTAASTSIENVLIAPSIDSVVSAIVVSAANVSLDIEVRDKNATIECVTAILTTAAADDLTINLKYQGFIDGNACVAPIQLVGCDTARIYVDFYGEASKAVVDFLTTACLDIYIRGYFFNDNVALTKNVIDSAGSGDWFVQGWDGKGGYLFTGSDAIALAASGNTGAQADVTASLEADFLDKVVAADDRTASLAYPDSVADESILAFLMSKSASPVKTSYDNTTDSLEAIRDIIDTDDQADKSAVTAAAVMVNGNTIFTIANGPIEILELVSICITDNNATASTLQYSCNPTVGAATVFSGASASLTSASAGAAVVLNMTALDTAPDLVDPLVAFSAVKARGIIVNEGIITIVIGAGSTTGTWTHYLRYRPLGRGITVAGT